MKSFSRKIWILLILAMLLAMGAGCQKSLPPAGDGQSQAGQEEIKKLLPEKTGYKWIYHGFAEYGHQMELTGISSGEKETVYQVTGEVYDPSGGEAQGDFSLSIQYVVRDGSLIMRQNAPKLMDSFQELELIRAPLEANTQWEQKALHKRENKEYFLNCTIKEVKNEQDGKVYVVEYQDKNSNFFERRWIKENTGVITLETVWNFSDGPVEMGYMLYAEGSGYGK